MGYVTYNADDEEPDCNRCDLADNDRYCAEVCGEIHGWWRYQRTERIDEENIDEKIFR